MTSFDYFVLFIIGLSVVVSMMRGAVKEILAVAGWIIAFYVARTYASQLIPLLPSDIPTESLKVLAAMIILMLAVLLVTSLISIALSGLIKKLGMNWLNRGVGAAFGFVRGLLIVCLLVFLAGFTQLPKDERWTNAMFSAPLEALVKTVQPWLPPSIAKHFGYD
ncbi:MAG TPA: CvpA family protein [Methylophilus sp.]|nr:CvpA family protein [Methylophilus sp.]HQQ33935.1 CvpA family protein [Methylophilus sp.]